jgi:hypothetical protein
VQPSAKIRQKQPNAYHSSAVQNRNASKEIAIGQLKEFVGHR